MSCFLYAVDNPVILGDGTGYLQDVWTVRVSSRIFLIVRSLYLH